MPTGIETSASTRTARARNPWLQQRGLSNTVPPPGAVEVSAMPEKATVEFWKDLKPIANVFKPADPGNAAAGDCR